jgi:predicted nucleic acid-binding protein
MAWVVDSCVLLDIQSSDINFGMASAICLAKYQSDGLAIAPVTYVELAPAFRGDRLIEEAFLERIGVQWLTTWTRADTETAHHLWADQVRQKRSGHGNRRPVADVFIEAFAKRFQGLITRNPKHFSTVPVVVP